MIRWENSETRLSVTGHAGQAPHGQDIVCAGVSALVQTLYWSLKETRSKLKAEPFCGNFTLDKTGLDEEGKILVRSFCLGMDLMKKSYPEYFE